MRGLHNVRFGEALDYDIFEWFFEQAVFHFLNASLL
jgi:hypothetical protein